LNKNTSEFKFFQLVVKNL